MAASPTTKEKIQLTDRINRIQISPTAAVIAEADKLKGSPEAKLINSTATMRLSPSACQSVGLGCSVKGRRYS